MGKMHGICVKPSETQGEEFNQGWTRRRTRGCIQGLVWRVGGGGFIIDHVMSKRCYCECVIQHVSHVFG